MRVIAQATWLALVASALAWSSSARAEPGDALYASAAAHYRAGRWREACEDFEALLAMPIDQSTKQYAYFYYGEALTQLGRYADARNQFTRLLDADKDHRFARQALFRRAEAGYLAGDSAAAKTDLDSFIKRFAEDDLSAYALFYRAHLEETDGDSKAAQRSFASAAEQFARKLESGADTPSDAPSARLETAASLAICYARLGRISDAEDSLAIAQTVGQKSATVDRARVEIAEASYATSDYETAAKLFGLRW